MGPLTSFVIGIVCLYAGTALAGREFRTSPNPVAGNLSPIATLLLWLGPVNLLLKVVGFTYHHESAEDAWRRVTSFFGEHLQQPDRPSH